LPENKTVLIVGASGLVGTAAATSFVDAGWAVITTSRRKPVFVDASIPHIALDLKDEEQCRAAAEGMTNLTYVVYAAVYEQPGVIKGWKDDEHIETNGRMLKNIIDPLADSGNLSHVSVLQGTKAYGILHEQMRIPGRESQPRVDYPNFYWLQEDYIRQKSEEREFDFSIFRPQVVVGPNYGVNLNPIPVIGVYAAIRKKEGLPFSFPGTPNVVLEPTDCTLIGDACLWAAENERAAGETYNLTNGEVFCWSDMWPAFAKTMGVNTGPDESISMVDYLSTRGPMWDEIVNDHGLQSLTLEEILGESAYYADWVFAYNAKRTPRPAFVSTVKIKEHGFPNVYNTEERICHWLRYLIGQNILPGPI
jgi:nucleoside-diphosphate-sugar epimerase